MKHIILSTYVLILLIVMSDNIPIRAMSQQHHTEIQMIQDANSPETIAAEHARAAKWQALMGQARVALTKNDMRKAEALLKQALSFEPDDGEARVRLAEIHLYTKQPEIAAADLSPLVNPRPNYSNSMGREISVCMMYVLAQLGSWNWGAAAACYEKSFRSDLAWSLPGGGPAHNFPDLHFDPNNPDFSGLRAQANLIQGAYQPEFIEEKDKPRYMLDHLRLSLKDNPRSLDATFLSGFMLVKMERFSEARAAFEKAMKLASKEARPEVQKALDALKTQEEAKRSKEASAKSHP